MPSVGLLGALLLRYSLGSVGLSCPTVANGEVYASGFVGGSYAQVFAFRAERAVPLNPSGAQQLKTLNHMHASEGLPRSEVNLKCLLRLIGTTIANGAIALKTPGSSIECNRDFTTVRVNRHACIPTRGEK